MPNNKPTQSNEDLVDNIWDVVRLDSLASSRIGYPRANTKVKIMKLIEAQVLQAQLNEVLEWHKRTLKEVPHPSDISQTLYAQEKRIAHLKEELEALNGRPEIR